MSKWTVEAEDAGTPTKPFWVIVEDGRWIAEVFDEENACLMAAAPEMLRVLNAALEELVYARGEYVGRYLEQAEADVTRVIGMIENVLARAEGMV